MPFSEWIQGWVDASGIFVRLNRLETKERKKKGRAWYQALPGNESIGIHRKQLFSGIGENQAFFESFTKYPPGNSDFILTGVNACQKIIAGRPPAMHISVLHGDTHHRTPSDTVSARCFSPRCGK